MHLSRKDNEVIFVDEGKSFDKASPERSRMGSLYEKDLPGAQRQPKPS